MTARPTALLRIKRAIAIKYAKAPEFAQTEFVQHPHSSLSACFAAPRRVNGECGNNRRQHPRRQSRKHGKSVLEAERDQLRVALAATRGTVLDLRSHLSDLRAAHEFLQVSREAAVAEARAARGQAAAVGTELSAMRLDRDALVAERDWLRGVRAAQEARLRDLEPIARQAEMLAGQAQTLAAERDTLARRAAPLDRLVRDLRWEDGPRAVRAVLPLARLARRLHGG